jgi:hypothetical protein
MDEERKSPRVAVTEAWRKEQQAKRAAYEARRRAWTRRFESGSDAGDDDTVAPDGAAEAGSGETGPRQAPVRRGRRGGIIKDERQARFTF